MKNLSKNNGVNFNLSNIFVSFHKGRGGRFNNPGHITFRGEYDFQDLIDVCSDNLMLIDTDEDGGPLPVAEHRLIDTGSNEILTGEEIYGKTGTLDFNGQYDTDYTKTADDLSDEEWDAIDLDELDPYDDLYLAKRDRILDEVMDLQDLADLWNSGGALADNDLLYTLCYLNGWNVWDGSSSYLADDGEYVISLGSEATVKLIEVYDLEDDAQDRCRVILNPADETGETLLLVNLSLDDFFGGVAVSNGDAHEIDEDMVHCLAQYDSHEIYTPDDDIFDDTCAILDVPTDRFDVKETHKFWNSQNPLDHCWAVKRDDYSEK